MSFELQLISMHSNNKQQQMNALSYTRVYNITQSVSQMLEHRVSPMRASLSLQIEMEGYANFSLSQRWTSPNVLTFVWTQRWQIFTNMDINTIRMVQNEEISQHSSKAWFETKTKTKYLDNIVKDEWTIWAT